MKPKAVKRMTDNYQTTTYLEGIISVSAAITANKREIYNVFIDKSKYEKRDRKITHLISFLKKMSVPYSLSERTYIDSIADGTSHGGVVAKVGEYAYSGLDETLNSLKNNSYAVMLDGVEDPYNFGYSIRNLFAFGCKSFIVPSRNWLSASNVVATASAGASELCSISCIENDLQLVDALKNSNIKIICSALSSTSIPLFDFKPDSPFVLFIGGEKRGISKAFMEIADSVIHIPYSNENAKYSLPTASCAAIFGSYLSSLK